MTPAASPGRGRTSHAVAWVSLALLACVVALVLLVAGNSPQKDDVAWLLYVARKWMAGKRLYVDLVEVNPPLIVWIYAVPAKLAQWLGVMPKTVANPLFAAMVLAPCWWAACLLHGRAALFARRAPVFAVLGGVLLLLPGEEFGQREHLLAAAILPYLVLLVRGLDGEAEPRRQAVPAGILAGLACALKPSYALAFLLMEVVGALRGHRMIRWASVSAGVAMLVYGGTVALFAPEFFTRAMPLALALYGATDASHWQILAGGYKVLIGQAVALLLCGSGAAGIGRRSPFLRHLLLALTAFSIGATLVFVMQGKLWFYHRIPAMLTALLALLVWVGATLPWRCFEWRVAWRGGLAAAVLLMFCHSSYARLAAWVGAAAPGRSATVRLERLIHKEHAKSYIAFSEWIALGFPVVNDTGVAWASRFDSMWALKGEMWRARRDGHLPKDWPIRAWVVHDFLTSCPDIAVVDTRRGENWVGVLIAGNRDFARAWSHYRQIDAFKGLRVLRRDASACVAPVPDPDGPVGGRLLSSTRWDIRQAP
jgi:hypothetical protein